MPRGVFVTGTDTGVGKTVASAALMHRYRGVSHHHPIRYWKPIQTGFDRDDDTAEVRRLGGCTEEEIFDKGIRLAAAVSPHLAARLSSVAISVPAVVNLIASQPPPALWIVEGAGGVLVPINESALMVDLMVCLALPVLVVARTTLGTINHTMLTLEALRARALAIAGVLLIGDRNEETRRAIEAYGGVAVVGELPRLDPLTAETLRSQARSLVDPEGRLLELVR